MKISVVIPVCNEEDSIRPLLDSILNQTLKPAEIVITDGGSIDATPAIITEYVKLGAPIHLIRERAALPGRGRNLAAAKACNEWIAFVDAGAWPNLTWLESLAQLAENNSDVDVVYGTYEPVTDTLFTECSAIAYVPAPDEVNGGPMRPRSIVSALMRKSVWQAVGGFPENLRSAEDLIFLSKIEAARFSIAFAPRAVVHWRMQPTFWKTLKRFAVYSQNNIRAGLWDSWQAKIFRIYGLLLLLMLPAFILGRLWLLLSGVLWLLMLSARTASAINNHRRCYPARLLRNVRRAIVMIPLFAVIDFATFAGSIQWLIQDRSFSGGENASVHNRV
jgi:glycosyltransferase involved in cell wall biosynthesis